MKSDNVIIIGAGVAGLSCAGTLVKHGVSVEILEKSLHPGGRCATRHSEYGNFDHGAQYFTARTGGFQSLVKELQGKKIVKELPFLVKKITDIGQMVSLPSEPRYTAVPAMIALPQYLSYGLLVSYSTKVLSAKRVGMKWQLVISKDGKCFEKTAKTVIFAVPADQISQISVSTDIKKYIGDFRMDPCWSAIFAFDQKIVSSFSALMLEEAPKQPLSWIMRNFKKNNIDGTERWVLHAGPKWSKVNLETDPDRVKEILFKAFGKITGVESFSFSDTKLWRFASGGRSNSYGCVFDQENGFIACGDWANGGRIEGAWNSGKIAARRFLDSRK